MNGDHNCNENASCLNTDGGFVCTCDDGYQGTGTTCEDENECELGTYDCDAHAICSNTIGSYSCICDVGFEGDGIQCSATHAVLVLNIYDSSNKPRLVSFEGTSGVSSVRRSNAWSVILGSLNHGPPFLSLFV